MNSSFKYKAFISYNHADVGAAKWLQRALETYRTPHRLRNQPTPRGPVPARLFPVFRDRDELTSSQDLSATILQALTDSESLIVVCSPSAARSPWVNQEIATFRNLGRADRVHCLIVDGNPGVPNSPEDCFPPALRLRTDEEGETLPDSVEPMAADLREHADGRELARLKIIAALLNVELDALRRRDQQRRYRRLSAITAGSVLIAVVTGLLAVSAMMAREEANQRRAQAEDLLGFMVNDLRESLEPIGRLDLLESVGKQAMLHFQRVDTGTLTENELLGHAKVLTQIGEIRVAQLQYDEALAAFREAFNRSAALYDHSPGHGNRLLMRGQAEFWVGYVHWLRGSLDEAQAWLTRYLDTSLELNSLDPQNPEWTRELGYAYHNLAVLAEEQGDLDGARDGHIYVITTLEELRLEDDSSDVVTDIADSVSWLADLALREGDLATAQKEYQRSTELFRTNVDRDPQDAIARRFLAVALRRNARIHYMVGELDQAMAWSTESERLFSELIRFDPSNQEVLLASAPTTLIQASIHQARGEPHRAREVLATVKSRLEGLQKQEIEDNVLETYLARAFLLEARLAHSDGELKAARESSRKAAISVRRLVDIDRLDDQAAYMLTSSLLLEAQTEENLGNPMQALARLHEAEAVLSERVKDSASPYILDPWARVLLLTDRQAEAQEILQKLLSARYRSPEPWPDRAAL